MYYNGYTDLPDEPPRRSKRSGGGGKTVALALVVALLAGALGGGLVYYFLAGRQGMGQSANAPVTIQTVSREASEPAAAYDSDIERVVALAAPSVVEVSTESKVTHSFWGSFVTGGAGSGVVLSEDGYIITNQHVTDGANTITVRLSDGREFPAALVGEDVQTDLAVLHIDATGLTPAVFADSDGIAVGQLAVAIGNPLGTLGGSATEGIISARDRAIQIEGQAMTLLQTSAAINPGNSGGGLFDKNGDLVGIVNAKSGGSDIEGLGFAIPANTVRHVVAELIEHGYVTGRPVLGISAAAITRRSDLYTYRLSEAGIYVTGVYNAEGLKRWDLIRQIDGVDITSTGDIRQIIEQHAVGDMVEVVVRRDGSVLTLSVPLVERQAGQINADVL